MRTDTYILNESQEQLTGNGTGVSVFEDTARKTLVRADTDIVDDDGDVHHFDTDSLEEAGRVPYDDGEVNQWETAGVYDRATSELRSSSIEDEIAQVHGMDSHSYHNESMSWKIQMPLNQSHRLHLKNKMFTKI